MPAAGVLRIAAAIRLPTFAIVRGVGLILFVLRPRTIAHEGARDG